MSWLSSALGGVSKAFNNTIGQGLNFVTGGASQNLGNILSGKGNLGDILNLGLFAGTGGLNSLSNIGKMNTSDFLGLLPGLFSSGGSGGGANYIPQNLQDMAGQISQADLLTLLQRLPLRNAALDRAYANLSPSGSRGAATSAAGAISRAGTDAGNKNAMTLARQGYGSGVQDAARLDARNQATTQGNSLLAAVLGPQGQAQNALAQASVYSPAQLQGVGLNTLLGLQNANANLRQADANYQNTKPLSPTEQILQVLPGVASIWLDSQRKQTGTYTPSPAPSWSDTLWKNGLQSATAGYNQPANYGVSLPGIKLKY